MGHQQPTAPCRSVRGLRKGRNRSGIPRQRARRSRRSRPVDRTAFRRLAHRANIASMEATVYPETRTALDSFLRDIIFRSAVLASHQDSHHICALDVLYGMKGAPHYRYSYNPGTSTSPATPTTPTTTQPLQPASSADNGMEDRTDQPVPDLPISSATCTEQASPPTVPSTPSLQTKQERTRAAQLAVIQQK